MTSTKNTSWKFCYFWWFLVAYNCIYQTCWQHCHKATLGILEGFQFQSLLNIQSAMISPGWSFNSREVKNLSLGKVFSSDTYLISKVTSRSNDREVELTDNLKYPTLSSLSKLRPLFFRELNHFFAYKSNIKFRN